MPQLFARNSNDIVIRRLRRPSTGIYIEDAVITGQLFDINGSLISGADDIEFTFVTGSDGDYRGTIAETARLTVGQQARGTFVSTNYGLRFENVLFDVVERTG
jgi:hypothetical protein